MLAGSMLMSTAPVAYASSLQTELQKEAESNTEGSQTETSQPETSQSETPATETETSQPETKPELETRQTETAAAETETNASQTGDTDASKEDGTSDSDKKDDGSDKKDGDKKPDGDSKDDKNKKDNADDKDSQKGDIQKPDDESEQVDHSDAAADYASNIIAGNSVYLGELSSEYGISFDEEFEKTMDKIEADYKEFLDKPEDFLAENWQDVLAVYVMKYGQDAGIKMDKSCRDDLEQIFFLMNVRSNSAILRKLEKIQKEEVSETEGRSAETEKAAEAEESTETEKAAEAEESTETKKAADAEESTETKKVAETDAKEYRALSVQDYIALYGADEEQTAILEKYTSTKCRQLCAIVTASKGFVRSEAGSDVSEERVSIVAAACSLIGKVGYFWGGKSYAIKPPIHFHEWEKELGNEYVVLFRAHHQTTKVLGVEYNDFVRNASDYPAVNDLMIAADILITDYSAIAFDYSILCRPIFCYAYDYDSYLAERGTYFAVDEKYPNKSCRTESELLQRIKNVDYTAECANTRRFRDEFVQYGVGATEMCINAIFAED